MARANPHSSRSSPARISPTAARLTLPGGRSATSRPPPRTSSGIACIYQQPALVPDLTVAENIALRLEPATAVRVVDWPARRDPRRATSAAHRRGDFSRHRGPLALHARAAARRNRLRARRRRPHRHHGRADRVADAEGSAIALWRRARTPGQRRWRHLHLAPARGDFRHRPTASPSCATAKASARIRWQRSTKPR